MYMFMYVCMCACVCFGGPKINVQWLPQLLFILLLYWGGVKPIYYCIEGVSNPFITVLRGCQTLLLLYYGVSNPFTVLRGYQTPFIHRLENGRGQKSSQNQMSLGRQVFSPLSLTGIVCICYHDQLLRLLKLVLLDLYINMHICLGICLRNRYVHISAETRRSPGAEVIDCCESPRVGAGNWAQALCKSSTHSQPWNSLSSQKTEVLITRVNK